VCSITVSSGTLQATEPAASERATINEGARKLRKRELVKASAG
jgi:hypothetical protein